MKMDSHHGTRIYARCGNTIDELEWLISLECFGSWWFQTRWKNPTRSLWLGMTNTMADPVNLFYNKGRDSPFTILQSHLCFSFPPYIPEIFKQCNDHCKPFKHMTLKNQRFNLTVFLVWRGGTKPVPSCPFDLQVSHKQIPWGGNIIRFIHSTQVVGATL